jgi:hypothetical protein
MTMLARSAYRLIVKRSGRSPSFLSAPDRVDQIEIVSVEDGEVVLFWDVPARDTGRMEAALRTDLEQLDAASFLERWSGQEPVEDA